MSGKNIFDIKKTAQQRALDKTDQEMIEKAIENTAEKVEAFIIEKKGLASEKRRITKMLEKFELPIIRAKEIE